MQDNKADYALPLDFDQYQRYKIASLMVEYYRSHNNGEVFNILEIGSNKPKHLRLLLPKDNILFTDIELDEEMQRDPEFQSVDGTNIPFDNGSFDFVIATDVLEHIPAEKRKKFLSEAARVSKHAAMITFPYYSKHVITAEQRVNAYYKATRGEDFIWLKDHKDQGLPKLEEIEEYLKDTDCRYFWMQHGDIFLWEKMYYSMFNALSDVTEWEFRRCIDQFYISSLFEEDTSDSCYRAYYVLTHGPVDQLQQYLRQQFGKTSLQKLSLLESLFEAQYEIHLECREKKTQHEQREQSAYICELEQKVFSTEAAWRTDIQNWANERIACNEQLAKLQADIACMNKDLTDQKSQNGKIAAQFEESERQRAGLTEQLKQCREQYYAISDAFCWKMTKPLRIVLDRLKSIKPGSRN